MTAPDPMLLRLPPGSPVRLPGTNLELQWDGHRAVVIQRRGGIWDLSPLTRPGRALLKQRLADRPHLGWWPITPLATRTTYRRGRAMPLPPARRHAASQRPRTAPVR